MMQEEYIYNRGIILLNKHIPIGTIPLLRYSNFLRTILAEKIMSRIREMGTPNRLVREVETVPVPASMPASVCNRSSA
jgi:hypothetical protein